MEIKAGGFFGSSLSFDTCSILDATFRLPRLFWFWLMTFDPAQLLNSKRLLISRRRFIGLPQRNSKISWTIKMVNTNRLKKYEKKNMNFKWFIASSWKREIWTLAVPKMNNSRHVTRHVTWKKNGAKFEFLMAPLAAFNLMLMDEGVARGWDWGERRVEKKNGPHLHISISITRTDRLVNAAFWLDPRF